MCFGCVFKWAVDMEGVERHCGRDLDALSNKNLAEKRGRRKAFKVVREEMGKKRTTERDREIIMQRDIATRSQPREICIGLPASLPARICQIMARRSTRLIWNDSCIDTVSTCHLN